MQSVFSSLEDTTVSNFLSTIAYISQIRSHFLLQYELEALCLELYNCLKTVDSIKIVETILACLVNVKKHNYFTHDNFTIIINDKWFLKIIVMACLRHAKEIFRKKNTSISVQHKHQVLQEAMLIFQAHKMESVLMLRLIENIIKNNKYIINSYIAVELLLFTQKVAISPIDGFKSYAHTISKIVLPILDQEDLTIFLDFNLLPFKGIETSELVPFFKQDSNDKEIVGNKVTKIIKMFSNNIENREGGFLYRSVLFEDFSYWKEVVWPQFFVKFQIIELDGEFFQSLVKYWIPQCVTAYKLDFYIFICTTPICNSLKGHILLETRRKGLLEEYNKETVQLLKSLITDNATSNLALKIVSSYFKRNLYPSETELQLVNGFLYGQTEALDTEELKCLCRFLSQIGVVGSELYNLKVQSESQKRYFSFYKNYAIGLFSFGLKSLKTNHKTIGVQILMLFWKLTSNENTYLLNYKLDKESNQFYGSIFQNKDVHNDLIRQALLESNGNFPELTKLGQLIRFSNKLSSNDYLLKFIDKCTELISIMAAESVKNVSSIIVSQNEPEENVLLLHNLFDAVGKHFQKFSYCLKGVFKGVLLFEAILEVSKNAHCPLPCTFVNFDKYCLPVLADILQNDFVDQTYKQEIKKRNLDASDQQYSLLCKIKKIVESLFNNLLQFIIQENNIWDFLDKPKVINLLVQIIETSNMRRPTTLSAEALKHVAKLIDEECQKDKANVCFDVIKRDNEAASYKIELLHETLQKLLEVASVQNLTIRRNPESRLIIHALCQSDVHIRKPALYQTFQHLLKILSDPQSSDSTISSAMHCTETLISDNTIYSHTLRFVPDVILQCVVHFKNRNWIVRNANIQLARSLIDRFLGVLIGQNNRPKSVEDLFCLFPQLVACFYQTLSEKPLTDSALVVMQIFSESQIRKQPINTVFLNITRDIFLRVFITLIKENSDHYGSFGVRAYTSLCLEEEISHIIEHVVDFVIDNFTYIKKKHTMRNFILLLNALYDKFLAYIEDFPVKSRGYYVIHASFDKLSMFLKQNKTEQFDLLLLKVLSVHEVLSIIKMSNFDTSDYTQRVWLHNYVPFLLINVEADVIEESLKGILFKDISDCLQVKILSILVDRLTKKYFPSNILENISNILVQKLLTIDNSNNYLLLCYFKVISLFFRCNKMLKIKDFVITAMRSCYTKVKNIYKIFVFILILTKVSNKNDCDKKFIKSAIQFFQNSDLGNFEIAEVISELLPCLYINACCLCDNYQVFKMATFLIVEHGLCHFVSFITKSKTANPLIAMIKILDLEVLIESFDSSEVACQFVKEFYKYTVIKYSSNSTNPNKTYYVEKKSIFVDRLLIDKIVLKFLRDFNKKYESFSHYKFPQDHNKR